MNCLILIAVISQLTFISCKYGCEEFKTCKECIGYAKERCVWCAQEEMLDKEVPRCQSQEYKVNLTWCHSDFIQDPDSGKPDITENKDFNATKGYEVQFRPQIITIKLRPGIAVPFDIFYRPAEDYPLDLYFLMDNSNTMSTRANELKDQTFEIYQNLNRLTNNVKMGIGSFIEKPAMPYADVRLHTTHAFKNHLSLTNDMDLFYEKITKYASKYGGNYDAPEAGLDGLMQVMKCTKHIGWRIKNNETDTTVENSRKIIIMVTDNTYHSEGEGKLIGAFKPNDMDCHLDENQYYDAKIAQEHEYPSVSQINSVAKDNGFIIIFAARKAMSYVYEALKTGIMGSRYAELAEKKINDVIINAYNEASRDVKLNVKNLDPSIKLETSCDGSKTGCSVQQGSKELKIHAKIKATKCTVNGESTTSFSLQPYGISDELHVTVEIDCKCQCEDFVRKKATECNEVGDMECGICKCGKNRSGNKCETNCNAATAIELQKKCKQKEDDHDLCNGLSDAKCVCGECQCPEGYSGEFCEFDNKACSETCPKEKGDCKNAKCICIDPLQWKGDTCNCPVSETTCVGPFSDKPCSGRGTCSCGKCISCETKDGKSYYGAYCEACKDCSKEICQQLRDYAVCNYETWKEVNTTNKEACDKKHNQTSVNKVLIMSRTQIEAETMASICKKTLDNGNILVFKYEVVKDVTGKAKLKLMIQDETEDPPIAEYWYVIAGVIGGILLIGLLTLIIWKVTTNLYDKREYNKFCQEAEKNGFDVTNLNPVYEDPSTNFVNPLYDPQNQ